MRFLLELQIDSLKFKVKLNPLDPVPYNIDVNTHENVPWLLEWWANYFPALLWNGQERIMETQIKKYRIK